LNKKTKTKKQKQYNSAKKSLRIFRAAHQGITGVK